MHHYMLKALDVFKIVATKKDYNTGFERILTDLPEDEYKELHRQLRNIKGTVAELEQAYKQTEIDKNIDFEALIKNCKKRFDNHDVAILEMLTSYETGYHIGYIADSIGLEPAKTRNKLRRLSRMGLVEYFKGGWTEDGDMFGSGYAGSDRRNGIAARIVENYLAETKQTTLLTDGGIDRD